MALRSHITDDEFIRIKPTGELRVLVKGRQRTIQQEVEIVNTRRGTRRIEWQGLPEVHVSDAKEG